jgi:hypothetical protein
LILELAPIIELIELVDIFGYGRNRQKFEESGLDIIA